MLACLLLGSKALTFPDDMLPCAISNSDYTYAWCKFTGRAGASTFEGKRELLTISLRRCYFQNYWRSESDKTEYASVLRLIHGILTVAECMFESCRGNGASCIYIDETTQGQSTGSFYDCVFTACNTTDLFYYNCGYRDKGLPWHDKWGAGCVGCFVPIKFTSCNFTENRSGGLAVAGTGDLTIDHCFFSENQVWWHLERGLGGAIVVGETALLTALNCTWKTSDEKIRGAALWCYGGDINLSDCSFWGAKHTAGIIGSTINLVGLPTLAMCNCSFEGDCVHILKDVDVLGKCVTIQVSGCIVFNNSQEEALYGCIFFEGNGTVQYNGHGCEPDTPTPTTAVDPSDQDDAGQGSRLGPGPIAAIVIVGILVILVMIVVVLLTVFLARRRYLRGDSPSDTEQEQPRIDGSGVVGGSTLYSPYSDEASRKALTEHLLKAWG